MNMTPSAVLQAFKDLIDTKWAADHNARVTVAADPAHAIELLSAGQTNGCAVVVFYGGDDPASDEFMEDTLLRPNIRIGVAQKQGLKIRDGRDAVGVLDQIASLRKMLRNEDIEGLVEQAVYKGMVPLQYTDGSSLHGYALRYEPLYADEVEDSTEE
jgi:hypothetical protein